MNIYADWAQAFAIFAKYKDLGHDSGGVSAQHDVVYAGPDPAVVSPEDTEILTSLRWLPSDEAPCWQKFP